MSEIPEVPITAVEFLSKTADIIETIKSNIEQNRLGRKAICTLLKDYSTRAVSDGRLMNAARQETHCANRGLFLAYSHMEFIWMLVKKNYTIPSTAVKWYSWKQFLSKNRLPAFWSSAPAFDLRDELNNIERNAALLYAEVQLYNVSPTTPLRLI